MTRTSEALFARLVAARGDWVGCPELALAMYNVPVDECDATVAGRVRTRVKLLRCELPAGVTVETGHKLGYKIVDARAAA